MKYVKRYATPLLCLLAAALVIFGTAARVSPLYSLLLGNYGGNAASDAMLVGKYWLTEAIPYRDFYTPGGPLYFAIQALGWALGGRTGIAVLETINLSIFLYFINRIFRRCLRRTSAAFLTLFAALLTAALACGGDSAQEWGLSLTAAALWLLLPKCEDNVRVPCAERRRAFLIGLLGGALLLIDGGSCGFLCGGVAYSVFCTGKRDGAKETLRRLGLGMLGAAVVVLPIAVYFAVSGALKLLCEAAFLIPLQLWRDGFALDANMLHKCVKCLLLLPVFPLARKKEREDICMLCWMSCGCLLVLLGGENQWYHYLEALPCVLSGVALLGTVIRRKCLTAVGVLLICVICAVPCKNYVQFLLRGVPDVIEEFSEDLKSFNENNPDVAIWMENTDTSYYLEQDLRPLHLYFTDQTALSAYKGDILVSIEEYRAEAPDILITTQHGWIETDYDDYTLAQVYVTDHSGNLCIYESNNE